MTLPEAIDTTRLHRVAGLTGDRLAWVTTRPFRAPHHTISDVGLIGGGQVPLPGDVSLAHHSPSTDRMVIIARASLGTSSLMRLTLPAYL
jgi:hypothetical protein